MNSLMKEHANHLDKESLKTFLCEAEFEINNRHLSMESINDPLLSPSILLTGKTRLTLPPPGEIKRGDLYCSKKGRCTQHLAQEFWLRWSKEYLQQLQAKTKWAR